MKKSRSDSKAFEMSSALPAPRRVAVPVLVRDGKRCPSPGSIYPPAPEYGSVINHHPTAFTSATHNLNNSLMSAAAAAQGHYSSYPSQMYGQYAADSVSDNYITNSNLAANMSPTMTSGMPSAAGHMTGFSSYNPPLVQQNCRWPW